MPYSTLPWLREASLFASGSRALAELLAWGVATHGWSRVWLPSYYCPDVPATLADCLHGLELRTDPDHALDVAPALGSIPAQQGDVVVVANQLGIRPRPTGNLSDGVVLVEDHSHDLGSDWALGSRADYAFASLRKSLPLPDGGAVWSPVGRPLPPEPGVGPAVVSGRLAAALARRATSADAAIPFRALARSAVGRAGIASTPAISPMSRALLPHMPVTEWRDARRRNFECLASAVPLPAGVRLLVPPLGCVAFALTLVFDDPSERDRALRVLSERAVASTVVWPLDPTVHPGTSAADADLSSRILSLPCDQRFSEANMRDLAAVMRDALRAR